MTTIEQEELLQRKQAELDARRPKKEPQPVSALLLDMMDVCSGRQPRPPKTDAELEEIRESTAQRILSESRRPEAVDAWLARVGVGRRHRRLEIDERLVPESLQALAQGLPDSLGCGGTLLAGPTGTGKTTAAVWLLRRAYAAGKACVDLDSFGDGQVVSARYAVPSARFVSAGDLFAEVFAKRPLGEFERCDLLVIDDWGMAYETDWPLSTLDGLLDHRWRELRSTVVTTNLRPTPRAQPDGSSFEERYRRAFSRLCDADGPGLVTMAGEDLRRRRC